MDDGDGLTMDYANRQWTIDDGSGRWQWTMTMDDDNGKQRWTMTMNNNDGLAMDYDNGQWQWLSLIHI